MAFTFGTSAQSFVAAARGACLLGVATGEVYAAGLRGALAAQPFADCLRRVAAVPDHLGERRSASDAARNRRRHFARCATSRPKLPPCEHARSLRNPRLHPFCGDKRAAVSLGRSGDAIGVEAVHRSYPQYPEQSRPSRFLPWLSQAAATSAANQQFLDPWDR